MKQNVAMVMDFCSILGVFVSSLGSNGGAIF